MMARVIAGTTFVAVLCVALGTSVPDIADEPLLPPGQHSLQPTPIPTRGDPAGGVLVRELQLYSADRGTLASTDELRLTIGTYGTTPSLVSATLAVGPTCVFRAAAQSLRENSPLLLLRAPDCQPPAGAGPATLTLTLKAASSIEARAALWTAATDGNTPLLLSADAESRTSGVAGRRVRVRSALRTSRAQLLAFMWDLPAAAVWTFALAAASLFVLGAGLMLRPGSLAPFATSFAVAAGLALTYAIVVPPLQAPDEPDHLVSFASLTQRPELAAATSTWARRIHFDRTTFSGDERFAPRDRERAFDRDWPPLEVFAEDVSRRSSTTTRLWQLMSPVVPRNPAHALLLFRVADAMIFGAGIGAGAALLSAWTTRSGAGGVALVLLIVPTLAFFGMHMSEIAFTLAAFILTGHVALVLAARGSSRYAGAVLGIAVALIAAGPRNGWPALLVIGGLCAGRLAARLTRPGRTGTETWWFWGGLAVPSVVLFGSGLLWVPVPFYEQWHLAGIDPRGGVSAIQFILVLAAGAIAGAVAERVAALVSPLPVVVTVAKLACGVGAVFIGGSLVWSIFAPLPTLLPMESAPVSTVGTYVWSVAATLLTAARFRDFDFLTWTTLWGGFGWVNPILPSLAIGLVTIAVSVAAAGTLLRYARQDDGDGAVVAVCAVAGIMASAAAIAISSFGLQRNVHGRYLLGACVVGVCLLVAPFLITGGRRIGDSARSAALFAFVCALHGYALSFLLRTYFG
jgi:hypothetical protein